MIYHLGINTGDTVWSNLSKASGWKHHTLNALCNSPLILHSSCMSMEEDALGNLYHLLFFITSHLYLRSIAQTIKAIEVNITPRMSSSLNTDNFLVACLEYLLQFLIYFNFPQRSLSAKNGIIHVAMIFKTLWEGSLKNSEKLPSY